MFNKKKRKANLSTHREIFVSHCSDDTEIMDHLTTILEDLFPSGHVQVFNSYSEKSGIVAGEQLSKGLRNNLSESDLMIAIITDAYERSLKCISEISSFWYCDKPVIPVIFNGDNGKRFIDDLFGFDVSAIIVGQDSPSKCSEKLVKSIDSNGLPVNDKDKVKNIFKEFFEITKQAGTDRPFIGSDLTYDSILKYCDKFGIKQLKNNTLGADDILRNLKGAKRLFIISTTGANLINLLSSRYLTDALLNNVQVTVILPNKLSDVCNDIAEIETPHQVEHNKTRLRNAFDDVMTNLQKCLDDAQHLGRSDSIGSITVCCAYTLLRQTIILAVKNDDSMWGWMSITLPPLRTNDGTPSMELRGKMGEKSLANVVYQHAQAMMRVAKGRNSCFLLRPGEKPIQQFFLEKESAREYWRNKQEKASIEGIKRKSKYHRILIEVAAQHPLDGDKPDIEFQKRLDYGAKLFDQLTSEGLSVSIYVPGSVHCFNGIQDPVSLSSAGTSYLMKQGVPKDCILGDDMNIRYKADKGVYNSADECYVASQILKDGKYADLYCVCSPNQMLRKQLFYLAFEVIPHFCTVPCDNLAHDAIYELFEAIPDVIYRDHTWQGEDSLNGNRTRLDRMPKK